MKSTAFTAALLGALLLCAPARAGGDAWTAGSPAVVPGEVIVKYKDGSTPRLRATGEESVAATIRALERDPAVEYAAPNYVVRAAGFPNDPGFAKQWHLRPDIGINAIEAWTHASTLGAPGGRGAVVAVVDTGVAYRNGRITRRARDLRRRGFVRGYDWVDRDRFPDDKSGHGTFVASAIAESTNNAVDGAGLAYNAKIMPLRVLDARGRGDTLSVARAVRYAARRRADVINLSIELLGPGSVPELPALLDAIRDAHKRGVIVVAAAGNQALTAAAYPARARHVIGVGATTDHQCVADYSNVGAGIDLAAPGGGPDAPYIDNAWDQQHCSTEFVPGLDVFHGTFTCAPRFARRCYRRFGLPGGYSGTSMASPQVAAAAAMIIATKRIGRNPSPEAVEARLKQTARDLGPVGPDTRYGAGLLDAGKALAP